MPMSSTLQNIELTLKLKPAVLIILFLLRKALRNNSRKSKNKKEIFQKT
jgi:hypothetical protein